MNDPLKDIPGTKSSYMYRPKPVYKNGLPVHKRIITRVEKLNKFLFLRILGKILRVHPLRRKLKLDEISSVLFIRYDAFGDMVVTTPLWRILKRLKPSMKIGVAGSSKNLGVIKADSDVDIIYDYSANSLKDFLRITAKTRQDDWDLVVMCKFNQKTRGGIISRLSTKDGFTVTVGTPNTEGHQALFSRLVPLPRPHNEMLMTEQLQYLLHSVIEFPDQSIERPSVMIDAKSEEIAKKGINEILMHDNISKYIVINIDAPEVRKWGLENNIALAQFVESEFSDFSVIMISLPLNQKRVEDAISNAKLIRTHYFPTSDVQNLLSLIRYSSFVVTPDTGIAHLASAELKPILGFYPEAGEWLPYGIPAYIIIPKHDELISSIPLPLAIEGIRISLTALGEGRFTEVRIVNS